MKQLTDHLRSHSLRRDGPFRLRSGLESPWYLDARLTTFDGVGARLVGEVMLSVMRPEVTALGGMTMGADPIAVATAVAAAGVGRPMRAFSIRKEEKDHGVGGRLVGPVGDGERVALVEDTTTTGAALMEALAVARGHGLVVLQAVSLVDRSEGKVAAQMSEEGVAYLALILPSDLGVA